MLQISGHGTRREMGKKRGERKNENGTMECPWGGKLIIDCRELEVCSVTEARVLSFKNQHTRDTEGRKGGWLDEREPNMNV